jgi:tripartite-type tricarboxylate transporter receptor subunit TctC
MRRSISLGFMLALILLGQAHAQTAWPAKPIRMIVGFAAGGSTDVTARIIAQALSERLGQPVVVENRGGAGGSIGSAVIAKAAPDGYQLLINSNAHSVNPAIYAKLPYDTAKDFTDITPLAIQPNVLVVNANSSYKTLMDLVNEAKAKPGSINWGHAGIGSGTHLNTERFLAASGIKVTQVPFKGTPEVFAAMFSGDVNAYWAPISAAMSSIKSGRLRPLAVSTAKRNPTLPDVPTTGEAGVKGADSPLWFGVWGPAGLPNDVVNKINADVRKALNDPQVKERLANGGNETMDMSPQEFARFVRSEIDVYQKVIKDAGIKPQ